MKNLLVTSVLIIALVTAMPSYSSAQASKPVQVVTTSLLGLSFGMMAGAVIAAMSGNFSSGPVVIGAAVGFGFGLGIALTTDADAPQGQETASDSKTEYAPDAQETSP